MDNDTPMHFSVHPTESGTGLYVDVVCGPVRTISIIGVEDVEAVIALFHKAADSAAKIRAENQWEEE